MGPPRANEGPDAETRVVVELGPESDPALIRFWPGPGPEGAGTAVSYALRTSAGWIFLDPLRPAAADVHRLRLLIREPPAATALTSDGHERFCYAVRQQWGTPVWGPALGQAQRDPAYDGQPDHLYTEGDALPGGLRAIKLAGAWRGDHALLWQAPGGERVLFSGDVLNGQVEPALAGADHFRREPGLYLGARPGYLQRHRDPAALRASLERLLREDFELIAGSHSRPLGGNPRAALSDLIETL
jgi:hypothetical protein